MLLTSQCEEAETAIKLNLINRLEGEGLVSRRRAQRMRSAELDEILDVVFRHCKRVMIPFADTTLVIEPKESVQ